MRKARTVIASFILMLVVVASFETRSAVEAASSVSVAAWTCPADLATSNINAPALAAACVQPSEPVTFALTTSGLTRRRVTGGGQSATWPAVAGDFQLSIEDPSGEPAKVVCDQAGVQTLYDAATGTITGTLASEESLTCNWYRLTAPAIPVATLTVPPAEPTNAPGPETEAGQAGGEALAPDEAGDPTTGEFSGLIDIGGRSLFLSCVGTGSPTILLEAGGPGGFSQRWAEIRTQIPAGVRVCSYDRAGLGRSDPPMTGTRTIQDSVNDLRALITTARIGCPCLMVGESWGANIIRLYAGQYPSDVNGLVLIDPIPPGFLDTFLELVPSDAPGFSNLMGSDNAERMDQLASLRQAETATNPPLVPSVVLTHGLLLGFPPGFPVDQLELTWRSGQERLAEQLNAYLLVAELSSNSIVRDQPELVVQAIHTVLGAVMNPEGTTSNLIVRRTDTDGQPQPGACFQIYLDAGNGERGEYRNAACDQDLDGKDDGIVILTALDPGDYVIQEIRPPTGAVPAPDHQVSVVGIASYVTVETEIVSPSTPSPGP